jgi:hypothetical protein
MAETATLRPMAWSGVDAVLAMVGFAGPPTVCVVSDSDCTWEG